MNANETTRFAILTPAGRGAVATIAVFGAGSAAVVNRCFIPSSSKPLAARAQGEICYGKWRDADVGEEVVVVDFASHLEIHCHGGDAASTQIATDLTGEGCVRADWQDWSLACRHSKFANAAIVALAQARSERTAAILLDQVAGALDSAFRACSTAVEQGQLDDALQRIDVLLEHGRLGLHLTTPWRVVIAGAPNVGKSSLLNAIVGYDRAIVVDLPGTTRDVVAVPSVIDGWPVLIADTAGLRDTADDIEAAGVALAEQQLAAADLVLLVFDRSTAWSDDDAQLLSEWPRAITVDNKCDLPPSSVGARPSGLAVSATNGSGVDELLNEISDRLVAKVPPSGAAVPFVQSQIDSLLAAKSALERGDAQIAIRSLDALNRSRHH